MTISQTNPEQLRPSEDDDPGLIVRIGPPRRAEAIERLVGVGSQGDRAAVDRFMYYARTSAIRLDGLWSRLDRTGRIAYSVLAVPSPGRTAMVFASKATSARQVRSVAGLIDHVCQQLTDLDVDLAQTLLEPSEALHRKTFLAAEFTELAMLSYLERPLSRRNPPPPPQLPQGVTTEPYCAALRDDLIVAMEASYEQTLDCPGLYGLRRTADILAGHQATGRFDPLLWTLLRVEDQPAGAVLLNPFPDHKTVELVYIGLAPAARGRGLGAQLLRHGLGLLTGRRERTVTLAVDQRNTPALALYQAQGFEAVVHRWALIRSLRGAA